MQGQEVRSQKSVVRIKQKAEDESKKQGMGRMETEIQENKKKE